MLQGVLEAPEDFMRVHGERGGVIVSGLVRTAAWLALFCVFAFDAGGIVTNRVLLDEAARVAAGHAADAVAGAIRRPRTAARLAQEAAAESLADQPGVRLVEVRVENGVVTVTAARRARVIVADRLPPLREHVDISVVATAHAGGRS